jgi:hypothetical protein
MRAVVLAVVVVVGASGCSRQQSQRCEDVCQRARDCAELMEEDQPAGAAPYRVSRSECVEACNQLERHPQGAQQVAHHVRCVGAAGDDCAAVLACE